MPWATEDDNRSQDWAAPGAATSDACVHKILIMKISRRVLLSDARATSSISDSSNRILTHYPTYSSPLVNFARFRAWSRPCARCAALFFSLDDARREASIFASSLARSPFFFSLAAPLIHFFSARTVSS